MHLFSLRRLYHLYPPFFNDVHTWWMWSNQWQSTIYPQKHVLISLKSQDKIHIMVRAAFTEQVFKDKEVAKFAPAIASITNGKNIMERHLIAALEALCVDKPKNFAVMLKQFYDEDALEELTILEWADGGRSEYTLDAVDEDSRAVLRGEAEPVVVWLQEADSDDESSDED